MRARSTASSHFEADCVRHRSDPWRDLRPSVSFLYILGDYGRYIRAGSFWNSREFTCRCKTIWFQRLSTRMKFPECAARRGRVFAALAQFCATTRTTNFERDHIGITVYYNSILMVRTKQHSYRNRPGGVENLLSLSKSIDYTSQPARAPHSLHWTCSPQKGNTVSKR